MATHDYVIANQSGAAFRTDLNNALAAIVSNNSNSSSPATTYAYQWWADTSAGVLKIRNSANNAWIELLQLDGTLTLEDGSASTPALAFRDDLDTGIFSGGANEINIATAGTERFAVDASGNVDIVSGVIHFAGSSSRRVMYRSGDNDMIFEAGSNFFYMQDIANSAHKWFTNGADIKFMVQNDGKVGIGVSSVTKLFHVKGDDSAGTQILVQASTGTNSAGIQFDPASGDTFEYQVADIGTYVAYNRTDNRTHIFTLKDGGTVFGNGQTLTSLGSHTGNADVCTFLHSGLTISAFSVVMGLYYDRLNFTNSQYFFVNSSGVGVYLGNGSTSFTAHSDERLKTNITELDSTKAYNHVKTARAASFKWNATGYGTDTKIGFIAQDWEANYPEVTNTSTEKIDSVENPKGIQYTETIPVLMAALKQAINKIEVLETKVAALEAG